MRALFWLSIFLVAYAWFFYPGWLFLRARFHSRSISKGAFFPKVSIVIAARNEAQNLEKKITNLQQLNYPADLLETIVISDGSNDESSDVLGRARSVRAILLPVQVGKAEALNRGIVEASGDLIVFMDARQLVASDSIRILTESFADPSVGCVSGALVMGDGGANSPRGVGSYWQMEKSIRRWESEAGSVVGATGALYAVRRSLVPRVPAGTILDDVLIPMEIARQGKRVLFEPGAMAWDNLAANPGREFRRKVRTLFGNYQLLHIAPWLLTNANPLRFEFFSHKLARLFVPFALIGIVFSSIFLPGLVYRLPLVAAVGILALGALSYARIPLKTLSRITDLALAFVLLNTAAIVAFFYFSAGKKRVWVS